ncbi:hypothetical protein N7605_17565 [Pantoea ananatis]|uniref:hypothetical protein n=1 Tax=Pantoea ananas TaxID=553 RepID=UPI00287CCC45|nr:hypothetical protein [Pantoea ananatis]MDS7721611.1 hypothetical protein [Pantoea ananatis]
MKHFFLCLSRFMFLLDNTAPTHKQHYISASPREILLRQIRIYGFIECSELRIFLNYCCSENIYRAEAAYIEEKLALCLLNHDNGGVYFNEMKEAYELVSAISNPLTP